MTKREERLLNALKEIERLALERRNPTDPDESRRVADAIYNIAVDARYNGPEVGQYLKVGADLLRVIKVTDSFVTLKQEPDGFEMKLSHAAYEAWRAQ